MNFTWLILILVLQAAAADPAPRVKVEIVPKDGAWVGQRVTLTVTLYTPDLFASTPAFEMPPIPGAIVLPPAGSPTIGSERIDSTTFTTQRHEFAVFAQRPETVRIPAFTIRFETNTGFGMPTVKREVTTQAVSYEARMPPKAEGLGIVIAARELKVSDHWDPEPKSLKEGDAITRTLTTTATGVPGMVLPPVQFGPIDGLASYPKDPVVNDQTNRGDLFGQRTDAVTFVCKRQGRVTIPDRTLTWFDLDAKELKTVKLTGRSFEVITNPAIAENHDASSSIATSERNRYAWWWLISGLGMTGVIAWLLAKQVPPLWKRFSATRAESEAAYFARLRVACNSGDPHAVYVALLGWLDHYGPMSVDALTSTAGDPQLTLAVSDLRNRLFNRSDLSTLWSQAHTFFTHVRLARIHLQKLSSAIAADDALPPLNKCG